MLKEEMKKFILSIVDVKNKKKSVDTNLILVM